MSVVGVVVSGRSWGGLERAGNGGDDDDYGKTSRRITTSSERLETSWN